MKLLKKALIGLVLLAALLLLAVLFLPWKSWLTQELHAQLAARGLGMVQFEVSEIGLNSITFTHLSLGEKADLTLDSLTVGYDMRELLAGKVEGLDTEALSFRHKDITVHIPAASVEVTSQPGAQGMSGNWVLHDIEVEGLPVPLPLLQGKGHFSFQDALTLEGNIQSADASHAATFSLDYPLHQPDKAVFKLAQAHMPWNGGIVRLEPVSMLLSGSKPVRLPVVLERVSLGALMQQAVGDSASATGAISGEVPLIIARDGTFTLGEGSLKTDDKGIISLPRQVIPGDNPKVETVREILQNFHYTDFSLTVRSDRPEQISMLLSLKGNNPEVYNGRMVNLNVNLTGDLLEVLQQGMITITDPRQLLEQD